MGTQGNSGRAWGKTFRALGRAGREGAARLLVRPARRVVPGALLSVVLLTGLVAPFAQAGIGIGVAHAADRTPRQGATESLRPAYAGEVHHSPAPSRGARSAAATRAAFAHRAWHAAADAASNGGA